MKWIRRFNESQMIIVTNSDCFEVVRDQRRELGENADLNHIDVSEVTSMDHLFYSSYFNGDVSQWNVEKVENMVSMFSYSSFNGNIDNWKPYNLRLYLSELRNSPFYGCPLQPTNSLVVDKTPIWAKDYNYFSQYFKTWGDFMTSVKYFDWIQRGDVIKWGRLKMALDDYSKEKITINDIDKTKLGKYRIEA